MKQSARGDNARRRLMKVIVLQPSFLWCFLLALVLLLVFVNLHHVTMTPPCDDSQNVIYQSSRLTNYFDTSAKAVADDNDSYCAAEYSRVTATRTPGLTEDDLERSRAYIGNRQRLAKFSTKLLVSSLSSSSSPVNVVVCGGSISLGHGVTPTPNARYSDLLEVWLNDNYPITNRSSNGQQQQQQHRVHNMGSHGADVRFCYFAKVNDDVPFLASFTHGDAQYSRQSFFFLSQSVIPLLLCPRCVQWLSE